MPIRFGILPIPEKPHRIDFTKVEAQVKKAARKWSGEVKKDFDRTVRYWRNRPQMVVVDESTGPDIVFTTGPAPGREAEIYRYVNDGTSRRWAMLSSDWQSKTSPGSLTSRPGSGRVLFRGRSAFRRRGLGPRPGIQARMFTENIRRRREQAFTAAMQKALVDEVMRLWG